MQADRRLPGLQCGDQIGAVLIKQRCSRQFDGRIFGGRPVEQAGVTWGPAAADEYRFFPLWPDACQRAEGVYRIRHAPAFQMQCQARGDDPALAIDQRLTGHEDFSHAFRIHLTAIHRSPHFANAGGEVRGKVMVFMIRKVRTRHQRCLPDATGDHGIQRIGSKLEGVGEELFRRQSASSHEIPSGSSDHCRGTADVGLVFGKVGVIGHRHLVNQAAATIPAVCRGGVGEHRGEADVRMFHWPLLGKLQQVEIGTLAPTPIDVHRSGVGFSDGMFDDRLDRRKSGAAGNQQHGFRRFLAQKKFPVVHAGGGCRVPSWFRKPGW
jgi:hypothetical protein